MAEQLEFKFGKDEEKNLKSSSLDTASELYSVFGIDNKFFNEFLNAKNGSETIKIVDFSYLENPLEKLFLMIKEYFKNNPEDIELNIYYGGEKIYLNFENGELVEIKSNKSTYRKTNNGILEWTYGETAKENYGVSKTIKLIYEKINNGKK